MRITRNRRSFVALVPLLAVTACGGGSGTPSSSNLAVAKVDDAAQTAATCAGCHKGAMALQGREPDEVAKLIGNIVAGEKPHPPLNLPSTDSASIEALAEAVTAD